MNIFMFAIYITLYWKHRFFQLKPHLFLRPPPMFMSCSHPRETFSAGMIMLASLLDFASIIIHCSVYAIALCAWWSLIERLGQSYCFCVIYYQELIISHPWPSSFGWFILLNSMLSFLQPCVMQHVVYK
jgi:hypothetical protein